MYLIKTPDITNPKINLAIEEYAVRNLDISKDYLFVYSNSPSVIIGKNQNPFEEVNLTFIKENNIEMIRRVSGGGAVYHEEGNINFSFITKSTKENFNNYIKFLQPIVNLLNDLKVPAKINHRNDLVIGEKKISGNAQFTSRKRMLSHGTLLFDADLKKVSASLNTSNNDIESKSTKSIRSKVTNIVDHLLEPIKPGNFRKKMIDSIISSFSFEGYIEFDQIHWSEINDLTQNKYSSWDWNWGRTPKFKVKVKEKSLKFEAMLEIRQGRIVGIEYIDSAKEIKEVVSCLVSSRFAQGDIKKQIESNNQNISKQNSKKLVNALFPF